jgi:DNA-directed RNA polymerase subunit RPC12/RpoP
MLKLNYKHKWKPWRLERIEVMKKNYECERCGVVTDNRDHLCVPKSVDNIHSYCGFAGDVANMCDSIREKAAYTCVTCGRMAEKAEMICETIKLH